MSEYVKLDRHDETRLILRIGGVNIPISNDEGKTIRNLLIDELGDDNRV